MAALARGAGCTIIHTETGDGATLADRPEFGAMLVDLATRSAFVPHAGRGAPSAFSSVNWVPWLTSVSKHGRFARIVTDLERRRVARMGQNTRG